jgi:hypothetical protein
VIEVKTGGREPYFLVAYNIVDGSSLSIEDSFGFEPNVAKALWVNNVVSNMPNMAFKVSNRMQDAYMNNAIFDSKYGFIVSDTTHPNPALISNNHFVNVEFPVVGLSENRFTAAVSPASPIIVKSIAALPEPAEQHRGRLAFVSGSEGDTLLIGKKMGEHYVWAAVSDEDKVVKSNYSEEIDWVVIGGNLLLNPLQERDSPTGDETNRWESSSAYAEHPYGWRSSTNPAGADLADIFKYIEVDSPSDTRVLEVGGGDSSEMSWLLEQRGLLEAGKTYRATAAVARAADETSLVLIIENGEAKQSAESVRVRDWEIIEVVFTVPMEGSKTFRYRLHCSRGGAGRPVLIDEVRLEEVEERERH